MSTSRAVVLTDPKTLEMWSFDLPQIGDDDGLVKVELVGVCGSDPGIYAGKETRGPRPYPLIMGHEIVGRVVEMGRKARERHGVQPGDRVVVEYAFGCGQCAACLSGDYTVCEKTYAYGSMISCQDPPYLFGAYSEYVYIHPNAVMHKIGDQITPEVGVLICAVLGNAVRWLRHVGNVSLGDTVALVGPGQQGLAAAAVAKCCGAGRVFLIGLSQDTKRLELAQEFGADQLIIADQEDAREVLARETGGRMADVVMDVTGSPTGAELALTLAGRGGTFVMPGIYKGHKVPLSLDYAVLKEIRMLGVFSHKFKAVQAAISLVQHTRYPFEKMITHRLPLEEAEKAIKLVAGEFPEENPIKVVLDPSMKA